jgi:serine/threonine-protein kinase
VLTDRADPAPLEQAGVPPAVQAVVLRALEKLPDARFSSMDDIARALDAAVRAGDDPAPDGGRKERVRPKEGATEAQRFSTGEVREVLARAVEREAEEQGSTKLRFEDLLAVASEVGIDPDSLREASRALRAAKETPAATAAETARRDAWLRQQRIVFFRHAGIYAIVNAALLVLGLVLLSFTPWWIWFLPGLAWAVGLAIHGLIAMTQNEVDWREHEAGMNWWAENQRQRHEERMARQGRRAEPPPPRVGAPGRRIEAERRVRVAALDTGRERQAEEEAAVEEPRERGRRRR